MADAIAPTRHTSIVPVEGGITAPTGFRSAAVHCGIKANPDALDLAVVAVDTFASMAGLFTTNLAQAAPVLVSKRHLDINQGVGCAIVVNSGCANACTGETGLANARQMTEDVGRALGCQPEQVLVASTGVIGVGLNIDRASAGIHEACSSLAHGTAALPRVPS
jgi:glutamate N-acetyltransferase/amino-acid N-acetyltransferase